MPHFHLSEQRTSVNSEIRFEVEGINLSFLTNHSYICVGVIMLVLIAVDRGRLVEMQSMGLFRVPCEMPQQYPALPLSSSIYPH